MVSSTLDLTAAKLLGASPIVFDGATGDSHTVTLTLEADPTASTTITIPTAASGTLITSAGVGVVTSALSPISNKNTPMFQNVEKQGGFV